MEGKNQVETRNKAWKPRKQSIEHSMWMTQRKTASMLDRKTLKQEPSTNATRSHRDMGYAARHLEAKVMVPWLRLLPNSPTQGHHVSELSSDADSEGQQRGDVKQNQLAPSPLDIFTSSCNAPCFLSVNHSAISKSRSPRMTGEWTPSYYSPRCEQNHQKNSHWMGTKSHGYDSAVLTNQIPS